MSIDCLNSAKSTFAERREFLKEMPLVNSIKEGRGSQVEIRFEDRKPLTVTLAYDARKKLTIDSISRQIDLPTIDAILLELSNPKKSQLGEEFAKALKRGLRFERNSIIAYQRHQKHLEEKFPGTAAIRANQEALHKSLS